MGSIQSRYPDRKFKVGDFVLAQNRHGNLGSPGYSHIPQEHVGVIEKVYHLTKAAPSNCNEEYPYKVSGHTAGWAEDELTLITVPEIKTALVIKQLSEGKEEHEEDTSTITDRVNAVQCNLRRSVKNHDKRHHSPAKQ